MKLLDKVYSKIDKTQKYIFRLDDDLISEVSYIDNNTNKDIICVNTHTGCDLGCKFCHTTDCKGKVIARCIRSMEIYEQVQFIYEDLKLHYKNRMLLVSYMGCGEPLSNMGGLMGSMLNIRNAIHPVRFGLATLIPAWAWPNFFDLIKEIRLYRLPVKIHLSLHFADDEIRKEWMPVALPIRDSICALEFYQKYSKNSVEVHYTLIEAINDTLTDARKLSDLLKGRDIPVKLLTYNERSALAEKSSSTVTVLLFKGVLESEGIPTEIYDPPGRDVGSSCGSFLMDYYLKYNAVETHI